MCNEFDLPTYIHDFFFFSSFHESSNVAFRNFKDTKLTVDKTQQGKTH